MNWKSMIDGVVKWYYLSVLFIIIFDQGELQNISIYISCLLKL